MIFDLHADIFTDITNKRLNGCKNIFKKYHLKKYKAGQVTSGIFVIWIDPPYDKEPKKRTIEIIKCLSCEFNENKDILTLCKTKQDFINAYKENKIGIMLGIEGLNAIGKDLDLIDVLYLLGARHASLTWNEGNLLGQGVKGDDSKGLSILGTQAIKKLENLKMIVDVSHANEKTFWDIYSTATKPFIASHSNCKSLCDNKRNLNDKQLKAIKEVGGIVGLNSFSEFIDDNPKSQDIFHLANHVDHMVQIMDIEHVCFGFDFCDYLSPDTSSSFASSKNFTTKQFEDISKVPSLIQILKNRGYSHDDIQKIKYKNALNFIDKIQS